MKLKYFTIETYESVSLFIRRIRFSIPTIDDYTIQNISESMGKGVRVITLINNLTTIKIEVDDCILNDIKQHFGKLAENPRTISSIRRIDGLGNIEDLYK